MISAGVVAADRWSQPPPAAVPVGPAPIPSSAEPRPPEAPRPPHEPLRCPRAAWFKVSTNYQSSLRAASGPNPTRLPAPLQLRLPAAAFSAVPVSARSGLPAPLRERLVPPNTAPSRRPAAPFATAASRSPDSALALVPTAAMPEASLPPVAPAPADPLLVVTGAVPRSPPSADAELMPADDGLSVVPAEAQPDAPLPLLAEEATLAVAAADGSPPPAFAAVAEASVLAPAADPRSARRLKRRCLSDAPPVLPTLGDGPPPSAVVTYSGKGSRHANAAPGPWHSALAAMPCIPPKGAARARLGLADVPAPRASAKAIMQQREARALVAILPYESARFVLRDPPELIASRSVAENVDRLVNALDGHGQSSLGGAASAYGRLKVWVRQHHPDAPAIYASHVTDFLATLASPSGVLGHLDWLRDWCGVDLSSRAPVAKPFRGFAPATERDKESATLPVVSALSKLSHGGGPPFACAQAAGWHLLAKAALRCEQASSCVVNAIVPVTAGDEVMHVLSGAVIKDKHPDSAKMRPRPFWAVIDDLEAPGPPPAAFLGMLDVAADVRCLLLDTDSPNGDPYHPSTTRWVLNPLEGQRAMCSLHSILRHAGLPDELVSRIRGHSFKRFLLNVAESDPSVSTADAHELGRFSGSVAQERDLEPVAALLERHTARISVLPAIYAQKAKVATSLHRLCRVELLLRSARSRAAAGERLPYLSEWGLFCPPANPPALLGPPAP